MQAAVTSWLAACALPFAVKPNPSAADYCACHVWLLKSLQWPCLPARPPALPPALQSLELSDWPIPSDEIETPPLEPKLQDLSLSLCTAALSCAAIAGLTSLTRLHLTGRTAAARSVRAPPQKTWHFPVSLPGRQCLCLQGSCATATATAFLSAIGRVVAGLCATWLPRLAYWIAWSLLRDW